jgi:hypothetical protein
MRIKNYRSDHHEFREFWWKFHNFWISGSIKINSEKKISAIKGWDWIRSFSRCKLRKKINYGISWGSKRKNNSNLTQQTKCHMTAPDQAMSTLKWHVVWVYWSTSPRWTHHDTNPTECEPYQVPHGALRMMPHQHRHKQTKLW